MVTLPRGAWITRSRGRRLNHVVMPEVIVDNPWVNGLDFNGEAWLHLSTSPFIQFKKKGVFG